MILVLAFIRSNWRWFVVVGVVLALVGALAGFAGHERGVQRRFDQAEIDAAHADLKTCRSNVASLGQSIDQQNARISAAQAEGARHERMLSEALVSARKEAGRAKVVADRVLAVTTSGDQCEAVKALDRAVNGG